MGLEHGGGGGGQLMGFACFGMFLRLGRIFSKVGLFGVPRRAGQAGQRQVMCLCVSRVATGDDTKATISVLPHLFRIISVALPLHNPHPPGRRVRGAHSVEDGAPNHVHGPHGRAAVAGVRKPHVRSP